MRSLIEVAFLGPNMTGILSTRGICLGAGEQDSGTGLKLDFVKFFTKGLRPPKWAVFLRRRDVGREPKCGACGLRF